MASQSASSSTKQPNVRIIRRTLRRLRNRIREYVLLEGVLLVLIWLIVTFWTAFAMDYLPVLVGMNELSRLARSLILLGVAGVSGWIIYRFVLSRISVPLRDKSLALLIEKKYPEFDESLVTSIESSNEPSNQSGSNQKLLNQTLDRAARLIGTVRVSKVLNSRSLRRQATVALLLSMLTVAIGLAIPGTLKFAGQRLVLLDSQTWPRRCHLEMIGLKVKRENLIDGIAELGATVAPSNDVFKISKGSSINLLVRAQMQHQDEGSLPSKCTLRYWTKEGTTGTQTLKSVGAPNNGFQLYSFDGQPFRGILEDIFFDIRGDDHRIGPYTLQVVPDPFVVKTELDCRYPGYMADEASNRWTPRVIEWSGRAELPEGTKVVIRATSNKPLQKVYVYDLNAESLAEAEIVDTGFTFSLATLTAETSLNFFLFDQDGIFSETPHPVAVQPVADQPPEIETALVGIGTAITPDAIVPIRGKIEDDYGIAQQWIEIDATPINQPQEIPLPSARNGDLNSSVDFRQMRQQSESGLQLAYGGDNSVALTVKASDKFDLRDSPNIGVGNRFELDVVSPGQLLRLLEQLEVGQRRRLEQIFDELVDAKDYLSRSKSKRQRDLLGVEPGDEAEESDDLAEPGGEAESADDPVRRQEMRLLFSQRSRLQVDKSAQELLGIVAAFENIRLQLINNRVDSEDRKQRLAERIIAPLKKTTDESLGALQSRIDELESTLRELQIAPNDETLSNVGIDRANEATLAIDQVLLEIESVLGVLVKYETQNELLEIVRELIKKQKEVAERTEKERKRKAFEGLLD